MTDTDTDRPALMPDLDDRQVNREIHRMISRVVAESRVGKVLPMTDSRKIFEMCVEAIFRAVASTGYFRFPKGYGSLALKTMKGTRRRTPQGEWVAIEGNRVFVRYREGLATRELLGKTSPWHPRKKPRESMLPKTETSEPAV